MTPGPGHVLRHPDRPNACGADPAHGFYRFFSRRRERDVDPGVSCVG